MSQRIIVWGSGMMDRGVTGDSSVCVVFRSLRGGGGVLSRIVEEIKRERGRERERERERKGRVRFRKYYLRMGR